MNQAIELHDTRVVGIVGSPDTLVLKLTAGLFQSQGKLFDDPTGYYTQSAELHVAVPDVDSTLQGQELWIVDGSFSLDDQQPAQLLALPLDVTGEIHIKLSGHEGTIEIHGTAARLELLGTPTFVENWPDESPNA